MSLTKCNLTQKFLPSRHPVEPVPIHLKQAFKAEIDKMLQAGVLKPVHKATPWINSFVLVEGNDQHTTILLCQRKLDQCFGHLKNVIVIADDIMIVGKQPNRRDHDTALTKLLNTARE